MYVPETPLDNGKIIELLWPEDSEIDGAPQYIRPVVELETGENKKENTQTTRPKVQEKHVLNLVLNDRNKIYWYVGITNATAQECDYSGTGIRKILNEKNKLDDKLVVLIKPDEDSTLQNIIDILNEMVTTDIYRYVWLEPDDFDRAIIRRYLAGRSKIRG